MINWDPAAQTALSDEEVISKPQKGSLYYVRYEIVEEPGRFLEVATTRPETIMADTGVAVHPNDKRYADLDRQTRLASARARENSDRRRRSDRSRVRHRRSKSHARRTTNSISKSVSATSCRSSMFFTPDGRINCPAVPELDGLDRFEARKKAAELLQESGLLAKDRAARKQRRLQRAQRCADRAAPERAMVFALSENEGSARGGARSSDPFLSRALGKGLRAMAREHSGLVHQPPGLVGPSDSGVVSETEAESKPESDEIYVGLSRPVMRELDAGSGHARYLVFLVALGLRDDGRRDAKEILSDSRAGDRRRTSFSSGSRA